MTIQLNLRERAAAVVAQQIALDGSDKATRNEAYRVSKRDRHRRALCAALRLTPAESAAAIPDDYDGGYIVIDDMTFLFVLGTSSIGSAKHVSLFVQRPERPQPGWEIIHSLPALHTTLEQAQPVDRREYVLMEADEEHRYILRDDVDAFVQGNGEFNPNTRSLW